MVSWWKGLTPVHKALVIAGAVILALAAAFWFTAGGVGDPEPCFDETETGEGEACLTVDEPSLSAVLVAAIAVSRSASLFSSRGIRRYGNHVRGSPQPL